MSALRHALERYITMRRAFGYKLRCEAYLLARFVAYMEQQGATIITTKLALDWATSEARPPTWPGRLSAVRTFARHLSSTEPRTQIPPTDSSRQGSAERLISIPTRRSAACSMRC